MDKQTNGLHSDIDHLDAHIKRLDRQADNFDILTNNRNNQTDGLERPTIRQSHWLYIHVEAKKIDKYSAIDESGVLSRLP